MRGAWRVVSCSQNSLGRDGRVGVRGGGIPGEHVWRGWRRKLPWLDGVLHRSALTSRSCRAARVRKHARPPRIVYVLHVGEHSEAFLSSTRNSHKVHFSEQVLPHPV